MSNAPVLLADPHRDAAPHAYVIQVSSHKCQNCGAAGQSSEVFARTWMRGQWGKPFPNLRPMDKAKPQYKLPIEIVRRATVAVPFCAECPNPADVVAQLPYPPEEKPLVAKIAGAGFTEPPKPKPATKTKAAPATTDDLMKGLDL